LPATGAVNQSSFIKLVGAAMPRLGVPLGLTVFTSKYLIQSGKQHIFRVSGVPRHFFYPDNFKTNLLHSQTSTLTR